MAPPFSAQASSANTPRSATPMSTPAASAVPSVVGTPAPGSPVIKPDEQEPPKRKIPTRRIKSLGKNMGYASEEVVDLEALKRLNKPKKVWKPKGPFRFFDLPFELRLKVLEYALVVPQTLDLEPENHKTVAPLLQLLQVSRRMHEEAFRVFYSKHTIRLFPTNFKFFNLKRLTVLTRLPKKYRRVVSSLELRLGPGWQKPPDWSFGPLFGLKDCLACRHVRVFVEIDPSHEVFRGFRVDHDFYTDFSARLLQQLLKQVPSIEVIEFDAYPSITKTTPLMVALLSQASAAHKRIVWGTERGWEADSASSAKVEKDQDAVQRLERALELVDIAA